jgi:hypothetical protein
VIIAVSGRKHSGKSLVSDSLVDKGFKRFSFATFLKESLATILGIPLVNFYNQQEKERRWSSAETILWCAEHTRKLSEIANEELERVDPAFLKEVHEKILDQAYLNKVLTEIREIYGNDV